MPFYFQISQAVFDKKIFKVFPFGCHGKVNVEINQQTTKNPEKIPSMQRHKYEII